MKSLPIVFLLAVICLAVAAGEARAEICNSQRTPTKLIVRRTWPGQTATTTTTTARPTTVTTTSSPKSTTTAGPSTTAPTTATTTTTRATTTTPSPILFNCSVSDPACGNMCGNVTSATTGFVQSPNFPGDYGSEYRNCRVTITAPTGWMIQLNFTTFNVEPLKAAVSVMSGIVTLLPITNGNTIPALVPAAIDLANIDFISFARTEPSTAIYNWRATFTVTNEKNFCSDFDPASACGTMCTNVTSSGTGVIQSPNFPADYGSDSKNCRVIIAVPAGKKIQLAFTTFNLETDIGNIYVVDKNEIYYYGVTGNTVPAAVTTTSSLVYVQFLSRVSTKPKTARYNWKATYTAV